MVLLRVEPVPPDPGITPGGVALSAGGVTLTTLVRWTHLGDPLLLPGCVASNGRETRAMPLRDLGALDPHDYPHAGELAQLLQEYATTAPSYGPVTVAEHPDAPGVLVARTPHGAVELWPWADVYCVRLPDQARISLPVPWDAMDDNFLAAAWTELLAVVILLHDMARGPLAPTATRDRLTRAWSDTWDLIAPALARLVSPTGPRA